MSGTWRVWVDTGGTFTDCLAVSPTGEVRRAKVLSSSALRGRVVRQIAPDAVEVDATWGDALGIVRGFTFHPLGADGPAAAVVDTDAARRRIRLDRPIADLAGRAFEVRSPDEVPLLAARLVTGTPAGQPLPPIDLRLATTRGTNALLERRGAPIALFVTRAFADLLAIGTQQRPELFALRIERPPPLPAVTREVVERIAATGEVLTPLDEDALIEAARSALDEGVRVAAVAFVNAYLRPEHERRAGEILRDLGFAHVTLSAEVSPAIHYLQRTETACVNAYLAPLLEDYLTSVAGALAPAGSTLRVMTSAGGLLGPEAFRPKDALLSGPAAGIVGAAAAGRAAGFDRILSFDMGGTSTDVARVDGDGFDYTWRHEVGGVQLIAPALAIESVAAGGGSVCDFRAGALTVGPDSAGADPGPACYGAGGPLTITDCNLLLGRLHAGRFGIPVSPDEARRAAEQLCDRVAAATGQRPALEPLLGGLVEIANTRMADAIRRVSVRKGYAPREYAMVAFGGAAGQHACGVARGLGVGTIVIPADAALLSARGLGTAAIERIAERQVLRPLAGAADSLREIARAAEAEATAALAEDGFDAAAVTVARRVADLRLAGQNATIQVDFVDPDELLDAFRDRYADTYGFPPAERAVEVESIRVVARAAAPETALDAAEPAAGGVALAERRVWLEGEWRSIPEFDRAELPPGAEVIGPALVVARHTTVLVERGWSMRSGADGSLVLAAWGGGVAGSGAVEDTAGSASKGPDVSPVVEEGSAVAASGGGEDTAGPAAGDTAGSPGAAPRPGPGSGADPEPVREQLFTNRFEAIVGEMGDQLQRTALSVNVKERLDFSCALLSADGELVANAPHIPVHLGALGLCVRRVAEALDPGPGDVVMTNHPAFGGSHLPDITVITPVHAGDGTRIGYVASRAHHAEIGGTRPGSMPPDARTLAEEGVVIPPTFLVRAGRPLETDAERIFREGPFSSRSPADNLADLRAQVAANQRGAALLRALADEHGSDTVAHYMAALTARCDRLAREALARVARGLHAATEQLDDGSPVAVRIAVAGDGAAFDFTGTGPVHPGNLNATPAIVRSAVLYIVRLLIAEEVPLNEGLLRPVRIVLPESLLNPPFTRDPARDPAVVGGNTEVSQRLVDTMLKALGLCACSQGTMNNVLWGTDRFGYYETIGGGAGAGPGFAGASGVHTHMTNTRITDVELLEHRYPVRLLRFGIRRGTGGAGAFRGGDGMVRETEFLAPMSLSILAQHRAVGPCGAAGGEPGATGAQRVVRAGGGVVGLGGVDACEVAPGDRLIVETPGGGGWGKEFGR